MRLPWVIGKMTLHTIDLSSPEFVTDPYPVYRQLRENGEPVWLPYRDSTSGMWLVTRYDDVAMILKEQHVSKDVSRFQAPEDQTPLDQTMLFKDPPDHTRLRGLASQAFTPARIRSLEPRILQITDDLLDAVEQRGEMDFMADFAMPLPVTLIAELLGVPHQDRDSFRAWSNAIITGTDAANPDQQGPEKLMYAMSSLANYFVALFEKRQREPKDDLISALITAHDAQDRLNMQELVGMCMLLLIAGHETTVNLLGNGLLTLLRHTDQFEHLKNHPEHMVSAIEEMLRYESPVQRATFRAAIDNIEIGDKVVQAGDQLSAVIGAANRDPAQFPDADRFDVTRQPNRHLAFGLGLHFCLGAPLARTEGRIGFTRLLERLPSLRLANAAPQWSPNTMFRGLRTLPVTF
jgi:cytochrome P450